MSRAPRTGLWLAGLVAAGVALRLTATGDLAAPPLSSPGGWVDWVDAREPVAAAVALARLVAELTIWYVLAVSALHVVAAALRLTGAHRLADALSLPAVARLVRAGLGVGVAAASSLTAADGPPAGSAVMAPAPAATAVLAPSTGTAVMRPLPAEPGPPPAPLPAAAAPTTWTVEPGDSLWSIAEEVLADAWHRPVADRDVDPYWRALVERNRARLVDPADPDLIHPGQVLELPPLP